MPTSVCFLFLAVLLSSEQCSEQLVDGKRASSSFRAGDIIMGGLFDVHTSGDSSEACGDVLPASLAYTEAMVFAIGQINRNKTLLPDVDLGFDIRDYCLRMDNAVRASYELVAMSDPRFSTGPNASVITAVIGPIDSTSATIVSSLFQVAHIPSVSPLASSLELSSKLYSHFYRTIATDNWRVSLLADLAQFFKWTYVATVAPDDSFGRYGIWGIQREAHERNDFCIALSEFIPRIDFFGAVRRIVSKLKSYGNVNAIFVWLYGEYARSFMKEAVEQGLRGRTWIFADGTTLTDPFFSTTHFAEIMDGSLGILPKAGINQLFQKHLSDQWEKNFTRSALPWWEEYWNSTKKHLSRSSVGSFLAASHNPYISYTIDAVYVVAHALHKIFKCTEPNGLLDDGKCPPVPPNISGDHLNLYIKNVSFDGLTGKVQFDENGDPIEARYDILNIRRRTEESSEEMVGSWDKRRSPRLNLNVSMITWNWLNRFDGIPTSVCSQDCQPGERKISKSLCCWECAPCPTGTISTDVVSSNCTECPKNHKPNEQRTTCIELPIKTLEWKSVIGIMTTVFSAAGLVLTLACFGVFVKYRNSPIVLASNRELSFVLIAAVGSFFVLAFLNLLTPTDSLCRTTHCWRYTVHTACVSVLLLKSRKILKAFQLRAVQNGTFTRKKQQCLSNHGQRLQLVILLSVQVILVITWRILDPPSQTTITRPLQYTFVVCKPFGTVAGRYLLVLLAGYVLSLSIVCVYYAFKARKIPENFNEARYIGFSMYILLLSSVVYYPVEFALEGWYIGAVGSMVTLVGSFSLLGCMFGPKLYLILLHSERNTREALSNEILNYAFSTSARSRVVPSSCTPNILR